MIKAPKLIWFDSGVQRALSREVGGRRGEQYESAIVAQILTTLGSLGAGWPLLRTSGGPGVGLLNRQDGILAFEFKSCPWVSAKDETGL